MASQSETFKTEIKSMPSVSKDIIQPIELVNNIILFEGFKVVSGIELQHTCGKYHKEYDIEFVHTHNTFNIQTRPPPDTYMLTPSIAQSHESILSCFDTENGESIEKQIINHIVVYCKGTLESTGIRSSTQIYGAYIKIPRLDSKTLRQILNNTYVLNVLIYPGKIYVTIIRDTREKSGLSVLKRTKPELFAWKQAWDPNLNKPNSKSSRTFNSYLALKKIGKKKKRTGFFGWSL